MKEFNFLEEHAWFQSKKRASSNYDTYDFENTSNDDVQKAFVLIPKKEYPGLPLLWQYQYFYQGERIMHRDSSESKIDDFPKLRDKWFYELVKEASASLEKRDKLRRIFS